MTKELNFPLLITHLVIALRDKYTGKYNLVGCEYSEMSHFRPPLGVNSEWSKMQSGLYTMTQFKNRIMIRTSKLYPFYNNFNTIQYNAMQYNVMQYNTIQMISDGN